MSLTFLRGEVTSRSIIWSKSFLKKAHVNIWE